LRDTLGQENRETVKTVGMRKWGFLSPRINSWVIPIVILLCHFTGNAQTHFQPVASTGLPYTIVVTNATINNVPVVTGSEIAVFDDTLCVGAVVYQDTFPVAITAWQSSPTYGLAGFTPGHSMLFKMFTQNTMGEWFEGIFGTVYETGNGYFGYGAYSVLILVTANVTAAKESTYPANFNVLAYPNPFNNQVIFKISGLNNEQFSFKIYSVSGQEVFSTFGLNPCGGNCFVKWCGQTSMGRLLPSGLYLFVLQSENFYYKGRVTFQQ